MGFADSCDRRLLVFSGDGSYHDEEQPPKWALAGPAASWRDYDGEDIFGDYTVDPATGTLTGGRSYQSGLGSPTPASARNTCTATRSARCGR